LLGPIGLGRTSWWEEDLVEAILHFLADGRRLGSQCNLQSHIPSDLLLPARPHLPKFPEPPKIVPTVGIKNSKHKPVKIYLNHILFLDPQGSGPYQNEKCNLSVSKSPQSCNSSKIVQRSNFKVSSETQGESLAVSPVPEVSLHHSSSR
jgi:hypothetical protein